MSAVLLVALGLLTPGWSHGTASAAPCSDVEVIFARGSFEEPGLGPTGQKFVDALRGRLGGRSVDVYAVRYPASGDIKGSPPAGAADMSARVNSVAARCPGTRQVLGGYSQGAGVVDLVTGVPVLDLPLTPLPPQSADKVAAIAVFGNPSISMGAGPITTASPAFGGRTIDVCIPLDPICTPGGLGFSIAHSLYADYGAVDQAADFVAARI
ncbi:cutinase family protein [Mycobacterium sp. MYCO198283]|uniref:cutinase family protein n=1 Tax=Mycobacterium sp. MYCO198283 TaxID=2883505 RepID=UPI001E54CE55|nr:cutinase family protein [Mycobacterium sp. MYCO198283]MCG5430915.1 cutinase family protein [Mycobacterium sp. MYCO198283]